MKTCNCPVSTVIPSLSAIDPCPVNTGQIQRYVFVKRDTEYTIASLTDQTFWAAKQVATDESKAVFSPMVGNPEFEPGEATEFGGGNETINGVPLVVGYEPTTHNFRHYSMQTGLAAELREYACYEVDVFYVNENRQFAYYKKSATTATGFPVQSYSLSDLRPGGYSEPDYNTGKIMHPEEWSDQYALTEKITAWNPLSI